MISTLALDRGASLVIELAEPLAEVHLRTRLTALSTEGETGSNMRVLSARAEGAFEPLSTVEWEKTFEGMDAVFTVPLRNVGPYLKIHSQGNATFVISTVNLSVP
jgi:hypothetical protein